MFAFHKKIFPMNPIILEYIKKSNEQSIEKIIDNSKKNKKVKFLLTNELNMNSSVNPISNPNNNNNSYLILYGLLFMSISSGIYFLFIKK
jgi:hypothetical protein